MKTPALTESEADRIATEKAQAARHEAEMLSNKGETQSERERNRGVVKAQVESQRKTRSARVRTGSARYFAADGKKANSLNTGQEVIREQTSITLYSSPTTTTNYSQVANGLVSPTVRADPSKYESSMNM